jgi:nicotinamide riboside transporter PnuC
MSTDRLKYVLFSIFLILIGLTLVGAGFQTEILNLVAGICGIIAGILFILYRA